MRGAGGEMRVTYRAHCTAVSACGAVSEVPPVLGSLLRREWGIGKASDAPRREAFSFR